MEIGSVIAAQVAQTRQEAATSFIRSNADAERQIADILQSAQASIPSSPVRGINVNVKA